MKKLIAVTASFILAASLFAQTKLVVGATPNPHAELLNLVKDDLNAQGIDLVVKEFQDYVIPNEAVESGEIDANFFQHIPYLESFNKERGFHLVNAGGIHVEPFALYSSTNAKKKISSVKDLKKGAVIAIPNDPTNEGRALLLLQSAGLITLKKDAGLTATVQDIEKNGNPLKLKFREVEAATLPHILKDVNAAVINGNYAISAKLSATKDGILIEGSSSPYVNVIAVKAGRENDDAIKALVSALKSDKVKDWIKKTYPNGEVVAAF